MALAWSDLLIRCGMAILAAVVVTAIVFIVGCVTIVVSKFAPRFHVGIPKNDGELCFYDPRAVNTGKDDQGIDPKRRMINSPLSIKWWLGISYRPAPKWFVGIIRWESKP